MSIIDDLAIITYYTHFIKAGDLSVHISPATSTPLAWRRHSTQTLAELVKYQLTQIYPTDGLDHLKFLQSFFKHCFNWFKLL